MSGAATTNSQVVEQINKIISLSNQFMSLYQAMLTLDAAWTDDAVATVMATMATVVQATDGTLGAVDGSPNVAHPMNPAIYGNLTRAVSSNQITLAKTIMDGFVAYINGAAVTTQPSARSALNALIGG